MFPASKNYPVSDLMIDDPLEELLMEFSHLQDEEDDLEENILQAEALMAEEVFKQHRDQADLIQEQIRLLEETSLRMKYLLDEVELYMPKKR